MSPQVSVLLNSYLRVEYIKDALNSVFNQEPDLPSEIVVISAREDWSIPSEFERRARELGVNLVKLSVPRGPIGQALRLGAAAARGHVIAILDDDDMWEPRKISVLQRAFEERPRLSFFHNGQTFVDQSNRPIASLSPHRLIRHRASLIPEGRICVASVDDISRFAQFLKLEPTFNNSSIAVRRSVFQMAGEKISRLKGGEDAFLLFCAMLEGGEVMAISDHLTRYRVHNTGVASGAVGAGTAERADAYVALASRHLESLGLFRELLPTSVPATLSVMLDREEAYYRVLRQVTNSTSSQIDIHGEIRKLISADITSPRFRDVVAAFLGVGKSLSPSWAKLAFLSWRMAW